MIYLQTVEEIRTAAMAVNPDGRFDHGRHVDLSQEFEGSYPFIFLYPWDMIDPNQSDFLYNHPLIVGFWEEDKPNSTTQEREELIGRMEMLKDKFMSKLRENKQVQITNVRSGPQYQIHNGTLSGFAVSFNYQNYEPC